MVSTRRFEEQNSFEIWFEEYEQDMTVSEDDARMIWEAGVDACRKISETYMRQDQIDNIKPRIDRLNI